MSQTYSEQWTAIMPATLQSHDLALDTLDFDPAGSPRESRSDYCSHDSDAIFGSPLGIIKEEDGNLSTSSLIETSVPVTPANTAEDIADHTKDVDGPVSVKLEPITPILSDIPISDASPRQYVFTSRGEAYESGHQLGVKRSWSSISSDGISSECNVPLGAAGMRYVFEVSDNDSNDLPPNKRFKSLEMSPRHFGYSCDQSDIGQSPPPSDLSFHPLWPRKNPSILSPVRINNDHQLRSRFRHKIRKFRQASRPRTDPRLSIPALLQNMNAPTGSQNIWTTASRLYSVPNDELVLRSLQSNLPSLQEVVESSPTGSESLDLPPLQRLLPSFDTMFKTAAAIIDEKLPVLIPTRETYRVSDIFPIRL